MRVLIVDDDPDFRLMLATIVSTRGHDATTCATTSAAIAALAGAKFEAVVVDFHIGNDTAETVLAVASRLDTAPLVIVCSGSRAAAPIARRWSATFMVKPFNPDRLLDCLAAVSVP